MSLRSSAIAALVTCCSVLTASAQVSVVGDLSRDEEVRPGQLIEGVILVKNDSPEIQEAKVYQTDYAFHFSGTNAYDEPGTSARSNARWISFSPAFVTLPPNASVAVSYTVTVPRDPSGQLVGTYWSMIMVEGIVKGSAESTQPAAKAKAQMGLAQTMRYAIQIATTIAGTGSIEVKFINAAVTTRDDSARVLVADIENAGERFIRPSMYVELFDEAGLSRGRYEGTRFRMYPGTSVRQTFDISSVPAGTYKALLVVDAGGDEAFAAQYTLKL
jgi:hypothetical protein